MSEIKEYKQVNGIDVVSVDQAPTPLGGGRVYVKAVQLTLADGTIVYACTWPECEYTYDNPTTIATGHWKVHEVAPDLRRVPFKDSTLGEILEQAMDFESTLRKVMADRDKAIQALGPLKQKVKDLEAQLSEWQKVKKILGK